MLDKEKKPDLGLLEKDDEFEVSSRREMKIKRLKGSSKFVQKTSENEKPNASKKSKSRNSSPSKKEKESKKTPNEFGQGNKKPASRNSSVDKVTKHKNVKKKKIKK